MSGRQSPSTSSRSRSSTTASLRSDSSREYYATNPQLLLSPSVPISNLPDTTTTSSGWSSTNTVVSESFQSAHSLATVRPHRSSSSASSSSSQSSSSLRPSNPQFVINEPTDDPSTPTKLPLLVVGEARSRASTFGGVPLPPSPLAPLLTPTAHLSDLPLNRSRSDSFSSLSSSLQLGGGSFGERRPKLLAGIKGAALFGLSLLGLYVLLKGLLPPIDDKDREFVKLPKSFDDLKALNGVLQVRATVEAGAEGANMGCAGLQRPALLASAGLLYHGLPLPPGLLHSRVDVPQQWVLYLSTSSRPH